MSTLKVNNLQDVNGANNSTPEQVAQGRAKAWLNMNGTGTVAIRDSFNVSSLTDQGTGQYRINLSISFANNDYCFASMTRTNSNCFGPIDSEELATNHIDVESFDSTGRVDRNILGGAFFGDV